MWIWTQKTGSLFETGGPEIPMVAVAVGYSGHGDGKNNPDLQEIHDIGPIPQGDWRIAGLLEDAGKFGIDVLVLQAKLGTQLFGRGGFLIHGENPEHRGQSSDGCIILPRDVRLKIWNSGDRDLRVMA